MCIFLLEMKRMELEHERVANLSLYVSTILEFIMVAVPFLSILPEIVFIINMGIALTFNLLCCLESEQNLYME